MKRTRINPDTLRLEMEDLPDPLPIGRIGKRPVYHLKELPAFLNKEIPPDAVRITIFDRAYLLYAETVTYTRVAALLLQLIFLLIALINALNRLSPNKEP